MKKYTLFALSLVLFGGMLVSNILCKKPAQPIPAPVYHELSSEVLSYCYFKKGTYWLYGGNQGEKDSVWVDSARVYDESIPNPATGGSDIYKTMELYIKSSFEGITYHYYTNSHLKQTSGRVQITSVYCEMKNDTTTFAPYISFYWPYCQGWSLKDPCGGNATIDGTIDSLIVNNTRYDKVAIIMHGTDNIPKFTHAFFSHARHIGIFQKNIDISLPYWELQSAYIIQ